jgi:hypothetical protein
MRRHLLRLVVLLLTASPPVTLAIENLWDRARRPPEENIPLFGDGTFWLMFVALPLLLSAATWRWRTAGGAGVVALGTAGVWLALWSDMDTARLLLYLGPFMLGGLIALVNGLIILLDIKRRVAPGDSHGIGY